VFGFWRKRRADDPAPPATIPRHVRRWVDSLPLLIREKVARLCGTEQEELRTFAAQWHAADRIDRLWGYFDRRAQAGTWSDLDIPMGPVHAAASRHQGQDADMDDLHAAIRGRRAAYQAQIAPFRETVAALVQAHPAVMQQLVTVIYHVGAGRFDDEDWDYQAFQATFPELASLVAQVRAEDAAAHDRLSAHRGVQNKEQA